MDRRIASVWQHTPSNNPTDGYDLLVSASFGKERVKLIAVGYEIEADMAIMSADIDLKFVDCTASLIQDEDQREDGKMTVKDQRSEQTRYSLGAAADASLSGAKGHLGGKYERTETSSSSTQRHVVAQPDYHRNGSDAIQVGLTGEILRVLWSMNTEDGG